MGFKEIANKNVILNYCGFFFKILAKSALNFLFPKFLSIENYSYYSILQANASVIAPSSVFGIPQILLRSGKNKIPMYFYLLHSLVYAAILTTAISVFYNLNLHLSLLLFLMVISQVIYLLFNATLKGKQFFISVFWAELIGLLVVAGCISVIIWKNPLTLLATVSFDLIYTTSVGFLMFLFLLNHQSLTISKNNIRETIPQIYNIGYLIIIDSFCWRTLPLFFLNHYSVGEPKYLAIFGLCIQISNALVLFSQAIIETWYPNFASLYHSDLKKYIDYFHVKSIQTFFLIGFISSAGIVLSLLLVNFFYIQYSEYAAPIATMVFFRILSGFGDVYSSALFATSNEKTLRKPVILGIFLLVSLNLLLTSQNILWGAVISFSIARLLLSITVMLSYKKRFQKI